MKKGLRALNEDSKNLPGFSTLHFISLLRLLLCRQRESPLGEGKKGAHENKCVGTLLFLEGRDFLLREEKPLFLFLEGVMRKYLSKKTGAYVNGFSRYDLEGRRLQAFFFLN